MGGDVCVFVGSKVDITPEVGRGDCGNDNVGVGGDDRGFGGIGNDNVGVGGIDCGFVGGCGKGVGGLCVGLSVGLSVGLAKIIEQLTKIKTNRRRTSIALAYSKNGAAFHVAKM